MCGVAPQAVRTARTNARGLTGGAGAQAGKWTAAAIVVVVVAVAVAAAVLLLVPLLLLLCLLVMGLVLAV